ncbi:MAG TPA: chaperonin [Firmicutes bacterium]|nr:chaperonin [Candidatus Fermentithermobacillaceae bacterium]
MAAGGFTLIKQAAQGSEIDEKLAALLTNVNAVRAIASAVEGTIGPKGLDTLLVDRFGEVVITNDGITILTKMDVNHPAAKMVINTAKAQEEEVGDGTTTATIMAAALLSEGVNQVMRGVPVTRIIEGIKIGGERAVKFIEEKAQKLKGVDDPLLYKVALVAGRENEDIASLVVSAARMVGEEKLLDKRFKLSEIIVAKEGAENQVFAGIIIDKERLNEEMPESLENVKILVVDDALEPEEVEEEALATEAGFQRYLDLQEEFKDNLRKVINLGVKLIVVDKGVSDIAEEMLTDAGVMVISRVASSDLRKTAEHTGAKPVKRTGLKKPAEELERYLGFADRVYEDEKLECIRVIGGKGKPMATILVGASTEEVRGERERICADAASSVQAAIRGGVVAGGGALEIACAREVEKLRSSQKGMQSYGLLCVIEALKRPLAKIVANAGFNPLEKVGDVMARQTEENNDNLAVDCDTGEIKDMFEMGVIDPAPVKIHALKAALEIACAILRIDTIIKKKDESEKREESPESVEEVDF